MLVFAQGAISFDAEVDDWKVEVDTEFEVRFVLKNVGGSNFEPPSFQGFRVVSGPNDIAGARIEKGIVKKELGYSYGLRANNPGKYIIESASIVSNGKVLKTNPLEIEIVGKQQRDVVFLKAIPDAPSAYLGEQFQIKYKFYYAVSAKPLSILKESEYPKFFAQFLDKFDADRGEELIDGKTYLSYFVKMVSLFPQQAGVVTIDSLQLKVNIEANSGGSNSFFLRQKKRNVLVTTQPFEVNILPLPGNAPDLFGGAVGKYVFYAGTEQKEISTDEALKITMLINGNGDPKRLMAPEIAFPKDSFEVFPPKVIDERVYEEDDQLKIRKEIQYVAIPKFPGLFTIHPQFCYFDTDSLKYVVLNVDPISISVSQGANVAAINFGSPEKKKSEVDIRPIALKSNLGKRSNTFYGSMLFWILTILPFVVFAGLIVYKQVLIRRKNIDPVLVKQNEANQIALQRLKTAKTFLEAQKSRAFYDEISKTALGYVGDKLNIPLSEMSKEGVGEKLENRSVNPVHIESFLNILQTCEMALFAGKDNAEAMKAVYENAFEVISKLENQLA